MFGDPDPNPDRGGENESCEKNIEVDDFVKGEEKFLVRLRCVEYGGAAGEEERADDVPNGRNGAKSFADFSSGDRLIHGCDHG